MRRRRSWLSSLSTQDVYAYLLIFSLGNLLVEIVPDFLGLIFHWLFP